MTRVENQIRATGTSGDGPHVPAQPRRVRRATRPRAMTTIHAILLVLLAVGAVGATDFSTRSDFRVAQSNGQVAPSESSIVICAGEAALRDGGVNDTAADETAIAINDTAEATGNALSSGDDHPAGATDPSPPASPDRFGPNQLWLVSTRDLPDCPCVHCGAGRIEVHRYECGTGWQRSSQKEFLAASEPASVTTVFVHGNDTGATEARNEGRHLYSRLAPAACPGRPVRFVIWSWPSERILGRVRSDIQVKACRTNAEAFYLADFLDGLDPKARVSLSGYSLGARVTTGALHLLGGGVLGDRQLETRRHAERSGVRVVLLAAAMGDDWLLPGMRYERALSQADRLVVMYNPLDAVLRFYPLMYGRGGPDALGYTGIRNACCLGEDRQKVCELNVSGAVHRGHGWGHYANSPSIIRQLRHELLMHDNTTVAQRAVDAAGDTTAVE